MRGRDWSRTPLGPAERWPQSLRSALGICLGSRFPIAIYWGERLSLLYNDAWSPIPGSKHPWALGRDAREVWPEIWDTIGPLFEQVTKSGEATYSEDSLLPMHRHGYTEECYFNFTFTPIRGARGNVEGVFNAVIETTFRVISERRMRVLRELSERLGGAKSAAEAREAAVAGLAAAREDVSFCAIYDAEKGGAAARLAAHAGLAGALPQTLALADERWPFAAARDSGEVQVVEELERRLGFAQPGGAWPEPARQALVAPIPGETGFLVLGASPRRAVDEEYREFAARAAAHLGRVLSAASALEAERARAEALAELDRAKTAFFSNVSHEFRTPLTLMLGPLEDILAQPGAREQETLKVVQRNGQRLLKLVNTLLDFARIEAGRAQASYAPTDLGAFTAELASTFRSACERAGLRLEVDCAPGLEAWVDREMWEKIVLNLVSNAFKFTLEGAIRVELRDGSNDFQLRVIDTGTGIAAAELPRMFERFHRVEGARGRSHEGSGIGLALVHELVKLHGGSIAVASRPGAGTTFTVTIPRGKAHLPAERVQAEPGPAAHALRAQAYVGEALSWLPSAPVGEEQARPGPRILLADDNADLREYARRLLAAEYQVEAVADGAAALAAARARPPDLVVSDVMMPGLDGFGLIRELRADPKLRTVPVILLSARAGEEARIEGLGKGADDYLVKPFSARELLVRVGAILQSAALRRQSEDALRESERRFREVLESQAEMVCRFRMDGTILFVNGAYARARAATTQALEGANFWDFVAEDDRPAVRAMLERLTPDAPEVRIENRFKTRDGERWTLWTNRAIAFDAAGRVLEAQSTGVDITERKKIEAALEEEARTLETLNRVGKTIAGELDLQRAVQAVTDAATEVTGAQFGAFFYNAKNAAGDAYMLYTLSGAPREAFARFGMPRATAVFAPTFGGEGIIRAHDITRDPRYGRNAPHRGMPEGHLPVRSYLAAPVVSRGGEVIGGLFFGHPQAGVFTERSERLLAGIAAQAAVAIDNARLHEQRLQLIAQLREADRAKDEFLATLSHELRNPLAPLRNALQLLRHPNAAPDAAAGVQALMERQVDQLVRLVDDLMEMSRITRGTFELRKERVELQAVLRGALETSDPLVRAAGHRLRVELCEAPLVLDGDPVRLTQVFANLLNNAARYTSAGGTISVEARRDGGEAEVAIADTGQGIAAEELPRIFDMFTQGERSARRSQGGLGIGLALVRRLAEMHGGTVRAESAGAGQGSRFTVRLPLSAGGAQRAAKAADPGSIGARRVLVVDDNRDAAESLASILALLEAEVVVAHDGPGALETFDRYRPDAVVLDIGMPGMNGYDVARAIRERPHGRRVPIIALTGWGQEEDRRRAREAGFDHHLIKPADLGTLRSLLGPPPR